MTVGRVARYDGLQNHGRTGARAGTCGEGDVVSQLCMVNFRLLDADNGGPYAHSDVRVLLLDADLVHDDFLGEARVGPDGYGEVIFDLTDASSLDSPGETKPDLYLSVRLAGRELARSPVQVDVDFLWKHPVTGEQRALTINLGDVAVRRKPA